MTTKSQRLEMEKENIKKMDDIYKMQEFFKESKGKELQSQLKGESPLKPSNMNDTEGESIDKLEQTQANLLGAPEQEMKDKEDQEKTLDLEYSFNYRKWQQKCSFPLYGNINMFWKLFSFVHLLYIAYVLPFRISFEEDPDWTFVVLDIYIDTVYIVDIIITLITPIADKEGKLIYNKRMIFVAYLKRWLLIDSIACFPLTYFRFRSVKDPTLNSLQSLIRLNFKNFPRMYKVLLLIKLIRLRKGKSLLISVIKKFGARMEVAMIARNFTVLLFMVNLFGCLFTASSAFDYIAVNGWIYQNKIENEGNFYIYVSALYWSIVTCATVGYGDILPYNNFEIILTVIVIITGVALFSYILSDLSTQFSELQRVSKFKEDREKAIRDLEKKFKVSDKVLDKIIFFFKEHESKLDIIINLDMSYLMKILPSNLKTQLAMFLYREAIISIKFFQKRNQQFYEHYLENLKSMRFERNTVILEQGSRPNEVCFVMSGIVLNISTGRTFNVGSMFGEADLVFKRERKDTYIAESECYILKYDRKTFYKLLQEIPEIKKEVMEIATVRDKIRNNQENIKTMISQDHVKDMINKYFEQIKEKEIIEELKLDSNIATRLKPNAKRSSISTVSHGVIISVLADSIKKKLQQYLQAQTSTTSDVYQILSKKKTHNSGKEALDDGSKLGHQEQVTDELEINYLKQKKETQVSFQMPRKIGIFDVESQFTHSSSNTFQIHQEGRANQDFKFIGDTKTNSPANQGISFQPSSIFNINPNSNKGQNSNPSLVHQESILNLRKQFQQNYHIFNDAKVSVEMHLMNLRTTQKKKNIPLNLKQTVEGSIKGLEKYQTMMNNLTAHFNKNIVLTNEMIRYQQTLDQIDIQNASLDQKLDKLRYKLNSGSSNSPSLQDKIARIKNKMSGGINQYEERMQSNFSIHGLHQISETINTQRAPIVVGSRPQQQEFDFREDDYYGMGIPKFEFKNQQSSSRKGSQNDENQYKKINMMKERMKKLKEDINNY